LPGSPTVVPQNYPGAGGLRLANYIYNVVPPDGSAIGLISRGYGVQPLLDDTGVQYDARKLTWVGSASSEVSLLWSWHTTPFKTVDDLRKGEMIVPGTAVAGDGALLPWVVNGVLGTRMRVVVGYPGNADAWIAIERGEGHGTVSSWTSLLAAQGAWIREKRINYILQLSTKRHKDLAGVPFVMDFARTESDRLVLEMVLSRQAMAYPFVAPPNMPADKVQMLRSAFEHVTKDPAFIEDAARQHMEIDPLSGVEIESMLAKIYATPTDVVDRARAILRVGKGLTTTK
jgi:hypothetical protein